MSNTGATTGGRIATILREAESYRDGPDDSLEAWHRLLDTAENAKILTLWRTIEELIDTRERGEWQHLDMGVSADGLRNALHKYLTRQGPTFVRLSNVEPPNAQALRHVFGWGGTPVGPVQINWLVDCFADLGIDIKDDHITHASSATVASAMSLRNRRSGRLFHLVRHGWERLDISERFVPLGPLYADTRRRDTPAEVLRIGDADYLRRQIEQRAREIRGALGLLEEAGLEAFEAQQVIESLSQPRRERIMQAGAMVAALSFSAEGQESLARLFEAPEHPLSPARLLRGDGDEDEFLQLDLTVHEDREVADALVDLHAEWMPVLMRQAGAQPERMMELSCRVLGSLLPESGAARVLSMLKTGSAGAGQTVKVFEAFLDQAEQHTSTNLESISPDDPWELTAVLSDMGVLVQMSKLFIAAWSLHDGRKAEDAVKLMEESIRAAKSIWELALKDSEKRAPEHQRQEWLLRRVNLIIGAYDTIGYTLRATEAARSGEIMQATGYGAQALGTAGGMLAALLAAKAKKLALLAGWVGWISLALVITGWWIVRLFYRTGIEKALARGAFGKDPYREGAPSWNRKDGASGGWSRMAPRTTRPRLWLCAPFRQGSRCGGGKRKCRQSGVAGFPRACSQKGPWGRCACSHSPSLAQWSVAVHDPSWRVMALRSCRGRTS